MSTMTITPLSSMTAREFAAGLGLAKLGKGKLSAAAQDAIKAEEAQGTVFKLPAHIVAAQERAAKPKAKRTMTDEHKAALAAGRAAAITRPVRTDAEPIETNVSVDISDWYVTNFQVGNYVRNPEGKTLKVTAMRTEDGEYTYFVDVHGKRFKAKVNARWGTAKGWAKKAPAITD
jgi:hypothetical protein